MDDPTFVISTVFGNAPVDFCHNPSAMKSESDYLGFLADGIQASTHQLGRTTREVDLLVTHLRAALARVGKAGRVIHLSHSQGSVITWLAAKKLHADECRRIEIISFGGAAAITSAEFPFARCINYYAVNDPILNVVPRAVAALKSGFAFGGGFEQEIIFLASRTGDPVTDHGLLNPTYLEALVWEGRRYQSLYVSPLGQLAFVAPPLTASLSWFPNFAYVMTRCFIVGVLQLVISSLSWFPTFAYEVTRGFIVGVIQLLILPLLGFIQHGLHRVLNGKEQYESVPPLLS